MHPTRNSAALIFKGNSGRVMPSVMRFLGNERNMILRASIFCLCLLALTVSVMSQQNIPASRKLDELSHLIADHEMARLDTFALELNKNANSIGYILGYNEPDIPPGQLLRKIYGYWNYLVNKRGINPNLIKVAEGGNRKNSIAELWLVPNGAPAPKPLPEKQLNLKSPVKFDEVLMDYCQPEVTIDLYELNDGLRFYADVLRENPKSQAWIIIYPTYRGRVSKAAGIARQTKNLLVRDFNIEAGRIKTRVSNRRQACMKAEIWIAPAGAVSSMATHNNSFNRTR